MSYSHGMHCTQKIFLKLNLIAVPLIHAIPGRILVTQLLGYARASNAEAIDLVHKYAPWLNIAQHIVFYFNTQCTE